MTMQMTPQESKYKRTVLYQTEAFEIVSCTWSENDSSPIHDHAYSQCFSLIEDGTFENINDFGNKKETCLKETGQILNTPPGAKHQIRCVSAAGGKTLHVYTPKISEQLKPTNFHPQTFSDIKQNLNLALTADGISFDNLSLLLNSIANHSVATDSTYFMNQLFSGVSSQMLAAEDLIAKTKATMATTEASPVLTTIENEVVRSLCQQIGWPKEVSEGITVPGGSNANFMALHCARQRKFPDYKQKGLPHVSLKIFGTSEAHYSLKKACLILGLGLDALVIVETDSNGRMSASDLDLKINFCLANNEVPLIVYATAGTTVLGAFDPIADLSDVCEKQDVWLHVDAAWGGPTLFSNRLKTLFRGVEKADSLTFDAHKFFGAGLTCAFFLTRHPDILFDANDVSGGDYIFHEADTVDRGRLSWQCGRRADAVSFWTLWKSLGTEGLAANVDSTFELRDTLVTWINTQSRLRLIAQPEFLNICVQILPPEQSHDEKNWSVHVRNELKRKNLAMVNYAATKDGTSFLRLILANPFLKLTELKNILTWAQEIK